MKRIILFLFALFAFTTIIAGIRADVKDNFNDISSPTITNALAKAKQENKKVLVYFIPTRDSATNYDYDRILFSYPDFASAVKNFVIVREWAARPKDKNYPRMAEIRTTQASFVFLDPNDDKFAETLLIFNGFAFTNEEDVVRKMIEVSSGAEKAQAYKPSVQGQAAKLSDFYQKWRNTAQKVAVLNSDKLLEEIEELEKILPGTTMNAVLKNYVALKSKENTRIDACKLTKKVLNKVVICFDEMSYLEEISKWDKDIFYPVLIWHPYLTPMFIKEFAPDEVEAIEPKKHGTVDAAMIYKTLAAALSSKELNEMPDIDAGKIASYYKKHEHKPRGLVLLNPKTPEYLGGLALAAARKQAIQIFDGDYEINKRITPSDVEKIRKQIIAGLDKSGYEYKGWDDIDYITIAANIPFSYGYRVSESGGNFVVDDAIGRLDTDTRYAFVGRLIYGADLGTYQAMCSLFLKPKNTLFFSRYSGSGIWRSYWPDQVAAKLKAKEVYHPAATLEAWDEIMRLGNKYNFIYINSSGGSTNWSTSKGKGTHKNIPFSVPCAVHMTHSGTYGSPFNVNSIAVRWVQGGAFCYLGSHSEPYLDAFVQPNTSIARAIEGVPLSEAFRHSAGSKRWRPWKLQFIGDPMFTIAGEPLERIKIEKTEKKRAISYVYKKLYSKAKKIKSADEFNYILGAIGLAQLREKDSDIMKILKLKNIPDDDISKNKLITSVLAHLLVNDDVTQLDSLEKLKMPKIFDATNSWMFERFLHRASANFLNVKLTSVIKLLKTISEIEFPDAQLDLLASFIKNLADNPEIQKNSGKSSEHLGEFFLSAIKKSKGKLFEKLEKLFVKK